MNASRFIRFLSATTFGVLLVSLFGQASAQSMIVVQNVVATPYDLAAVLSWDVASNESALPAESYEISYGKFSVEEGLAAAYDTTVTVGAETSVTISGLENGTRYYGAVKAIFPGNEKSAVFSNEVIFTPSSVYARAPGTEYAAAPEENDTTAPVVKEAKALTKNLVKVVFSESVDLDILLPDLSFVVNESLDPAAKPAVEKVEYKVDFAGLENEMVHKDVVLVTLSEDLRDSSVNYTVTVSAAIRDLAGNPIENGVTDFATFSGTEATEIPVDERPLTALDVPVDPTDTTAPENVTDFTISSAPGESEFALSLSWLKSISEDVSFQQIYRSLNAGLEWLTESKLDKDTEQYDTTGAPETEQTFKITATDTSGNENSGTIQSIRLPRLPSTGAPLLLLAGGASLCLQGVRRWRRKK